MSHSIDEVVKMSDTELLAELGEATCSDVGLFPLPLKAAAKAGREWFDQNREQLRTHVCADPKVRLYFSNESAIRRRTVLVLAIADTITASFGGVPVTIIGELIMREGLEAFCKSCWEK